LYFSVLNEKAHVLYLFFGLQLGHLRQINDLSHCLAHPLATGNQGLSHRRIFLQNQVSFHTTNNLQLHGKIFAHVAHVAHFLAQVGISASFTRGLDEGHDLACQVGDLSGKGNKLLLSSWKQ
jgi:hypothetical protein